MGEGPLESLIDFVQPYTKSNRARIASMIGALARVDENKVEGDIVECGVWRAGNIILARKLSPTRSCWLYDTFDGMTPAGEFDRKACGEPVKPKKLGRKWAACSVDEVKTNFRETGTYNEGLLKFIVGPVEQTLRAETNLPDRIALLRLDTDWYESTKIELEVLYPRLVSGGVLIVDDYGHWLGARKAVDDYFMGSVTLTPIDYTAVMVTK